MKKIAKEKLQISNLKLANQLARKIAKLENSKAVLLYGSVGKGYSDAHSDIDLVVICDRIQTEPVVQLFKEHALVFKQQELSVLHFDQYPAQDDITYKHYQSYRAACAIFHEGRLIDTTIRLVSIEVVHKLADAAKEDIYKYQTLMQYIVDTKVLFDRDKDFAPWQKQVASFKKFAPALRDTFVAHCFNHIEYYLIGEIPDGIMRNDIMLLNFELAKCLVLFLNVLYALNDRCLAYPKWEHEDIKKLTVKPANVQTILKQVVRTQNPAPLKGLLVKLKTLAKSAR